MVLQSITRYWGLCLRGPCFEGVTRTTPRNTTTTPRTTRITCRTITTIYVRSPSPVGLRIGVVLVTLEVVLVALVLGVVLVFLGVVLVAPSKQGPLKHRPHYRVIDRMKIMNP